MEGIYNQASIDQLVAEVQRSVQQSAKLTEVVLQLARPKSPWMSVEEAADYLGLDPKGKNVGRQLNYLVKRHGLRHSDTRTRRYMRIDVERIQLEREAGSIEYIGYS